MRPIASHDHLVVIGGQRCGTTWLVDVLTTLPAIRTTTVRRPEPKHFLVSSDHDQYDRLFPDVGGDLYLDKSTTYLERPDAARRAKACIAGSLILAVLRDPVERVHSNWRFSVTNGLEALSFEDSLSESAQHRTVTRLSTSPFDSLRRGRYAELLEPWSKAFGERLVVLQYEKMVNDDGGYLAARLRSAGLELPADWPTVPRAANAAPLDDVVCASTRERLSAYYRPLNQPLVEYGIDLTLWS